MEHNYCKDRTIDKEFKSTWLLFLQKKNMNNDHVSFFFNSENSSDPVTRNFLANYEVEVGEVKKYLSWIYRPNSLFRSL